jgi:hypothetical protein
MSRSSEGGAAEFGAESLGPEEHMRCMEEQRQFDQKEKKLVQSMQQDARELLVADEAAKILTRVMADLLEREERHHPELTTDERIKRISGTLQTAIWLSVVDAR